MDKMVQFGQNAQFWKSVLSMPPSLLPFHLGATYETLTSPSNLHRQNITIKTSCKLYHKQICTTAHILDTCKFALQQGRFSFQHDSVLQVHISVFQYFLSLYTISKANCNTSTKFAKAESESQKSIKKKVGLLHSHHIGNYSLTSTLSLSFLLLLQ